MENRWQRSLLSTVLLGILLAVPLALVLQGYVSVPSPNPNQFIGIGDVDNSTFLSEALVKDELSAFIGMGYPLSNSSSMHIYKFEYGLDRKTEYSVEGLWVIGLGAYSEDYSYLIFRNVSSPFNLVLYQVANDADELTWQINLDALFSDTINRTGYNLLSVSFQVYGSSLLIAVGYRMETMDSVHLIQLDEDGSIVNVSSRDYPKGTLQQNSGIYEDQDRLLYLTGTSDLRLSVRPFIEINEDLSLSEVRRHNFSDNWTSPIETVLSYFPLSFVQNSSFFIIPEKGAISYGVIINGTFVQGSYDLRSKGVSLYPFYGPRESNSMVLSRFFKISDRYYFIPVVDADTEFPSIYNFGNKTRQLVGILVDLVKRDLDFVELDLPTHENGVDYYVPIAALQMGSSIQMISQVYTYDPKPLNAPLAKGITTISFNYSSILSGDKTLNFLLTALLSVMGGMLLSFLGSLGLRKIRKRSKSTYLYPSHSDMD
ncbi:MAG: hypothetical protein D6732_12045 [Methanobacteriota archaeon]|nr:MAG: hypothetical protein D6732_12045 [Euryarchaeota archaeon]